MKLNVFKWKLLLPLVLLTLTVGCSSWVYRIDIAQGNYIIQEDIDKLRIGMTKEQVIFVLGNPVVRDSFNDDIYYYVYKIKRGMSSRGEDFKKDLELHFENDKLAEMKGDFTPSENFNTPLEG